MFRFAASVMPLSLRLLGTAAVVCSALNLVGCGGGSRAKDYQPSRVVSFGDENSAFADIQLPDATGTPKTIKSLAYTVNSVVVTTPWVCADIATPQLCDTTVPSSGNFPTTANSVNYYVLDDNAPSTVDIIEKGLDTTTNGQLQRTTQRGYLCTATNNWVQVVAAAFGFGFPNSCGNRSGAVSHAVYGHKVAEIANQVATYRSELGEGVLVTLMGGQNDIIEQYNIIQGKATDAEKAAATTAAVNELKSRAVQFAGVVDSIVATGAKVIVALTPDLGQSPLAARDNTAALLTELTDTFNNALYIDQIARNHTGREVVGVNPKPYTDPISRSSSYVYSAGACDMTKAVPYTNQVGTIPPAGVLYCTNDQLVTGAYSATYIWADDTHFAPAGHALIGSVAYTRASNQF